jgi:hypothetical protein
MTSVLQRRSGKHLFEFEDDVVMSRMVGEFTVVDMKAYFAFVAEVSVGRPLYNIADMRLAGSIAPDARRYALDATKEVKFGITVAFGMNPTIRVLLFMLVRAAKLLRHRGSNGELEFVATEQEARALVAARRQRASR